MNADSKKQTASKPRPGQKARKLEGQPKENSGAKTQQIECPACKGTGISAVPKPATIEDLKQSYLSLIKVHDAFRQMKSKSEVQWAEYNRICELLGSTQRELILNYGVCYNNISEKFTDCPKSVIDLLRIPLNPKFKPQ
jgi:hypothetical protein